MWRLRRAGSSGTRRLPAPEERGERDPPPLSLQHESGRADASTVAANLGPTRPDRLTIWPLDEPWELRVGRVPGAEVARVIDEFVW
jgi:hypothetical protein